MTKYNEAYTLASTEFNEVNDERKRIEEEARARALANQRNEIFEGVRNDTTWFTGVVDGIKPRVTHFYDLATKVEQGEWIPNGYARLIDDPTEFRASFERFDDNTLNGYSTDKEHYRGHDGYVIMQWESDFTIQMQFNDGEIHDFPMESVHPDSKANIAEEYRRLARSNEDAITLTEEMITIAQTNWALIQQNQEEEAAKAVENERKATYEQNKRDITAITEAITRLDAEIATLTTEKEAS